MLLSEVAGALNASQKLLSQINFSTITPEETQVISQKLQRSGIKPRMTNIKNYLVRCLTMPLDEVPLPERNVILRAGRPERIG